MKDKVASKQEFRKLHIAYDELKEQLTKRKADHEIQLTELRQNHEQEMQRVSNWFDDEKKKTKIEAEKQAAMDLSSWKDRYHQSVAQIQRLESNYSRKLKSLRCCVAIQREMLIMHLQPAVDGKPEDGGPVDGGRTLERQVSQQEEAVVEPIEATGRPHLMANLLFNPER